VSSLSFPTTQRELLLQARGKRSQAAFAEELEVDRTCLSRYENEKLGAPTTVINHCLGAIAAQLQGAELSESPIDRALRHSRTVVRELEQAADSKKVRPATK
jgi:DNA-binding XRE family transcriptional regulator